MASYRRKRFKNERPDKHLPQVIEQNLQSISHRSAFPLTCNNNCYYIPQISTKIPIHFDVLRYIYNTIDGQCPKYFQNWSEGKIN